MSYDKLPTLEELITLYKHTKLENEWYSYKGGFIPKKELEAMIQLQDEVAKEEAKRIWLDFKTRNNLQ